MGKAGKSFVIQAYADNSAIESIALKAAMALVLQKPHPIHGQKNIQFISSTALSCGGWEISRLYYMNVAIEPSNRDSTTEERTSKQRTKQLVLLQK